MTSQTPSRSRPVKLSANERLLLAALQHRAAEPLSEVAASLRMRIPAARHALKRLVEKEVVYGVYPFLDLCPLGFTYYAILFSIASSQAKTRKKFVENLIASDQVTWCGEFAGSLRYGVTLAARAPTEVTEVLSSLSNQFGPLITQKEIGAKISMTHFPRKYLVDSAVRSGSPLSYHSTHPRTELSQEGHALLSILKNGSHRSLRELAQEMDVPASTLKRRIEKLEQHIIKGYYYRVNPSNLGVQSYTILIYSRGIAPEFSKELFKFCETHTNITFFVETLGSWDYEVGVEVYNAEGLTAVIDELHDLLGTRLTSARPLQITRELRRDGYPFQQKPN